MSLTLDNNVRFEDHSDFSASTEIMEIETDNADLNFHKANLDDYFGEFNWDYQPHFNDSIVTKLSAAEFIHLFPILLPVNVLDDSNIDIKFRIDGPGSIIVYYEYSLKVDGDEDDNEFQDLESRSESESFFENQVFFTDNSLIIKEIYEALIFFINYYS